MARVVLIGGSGHIGTYLVPRLVEAGHHVINVTRGQRAPYWPHAAWRQVETVVADRDAEDRDGGFGARVAALKADVVVDLVCFTLASARALVDALDGKIGHLIHIGTIWVHGPSSVVPTAPSFLGKRGPRPRTRKRRERPMSTSPAVPVARSPRPSA